MARYGMKGLNLLKRMNFHADQFLRAHIPKWCIILCFLFLASEICRGASSPLLQQVGQWPKNIRASVREVALHQETAYLAMGDSGLLLVDVSDPTHPTLIDRIFSSQHVSKVRYHGNHLYVVTRHHRGSKFEQERFFRGNLHVLKLDDPYHPIEITSFTLGSEILGLSFDEHRLLLSEGGAHGHAQASIRIMDVSIPSIPTLIHRVQINPEIRNHPLLDPRSLIKSRDYLYVSGGGKVNILNWSETDPLEFIRDLRTAVSGILQAWHVQNHLFFEVRFDLDHSDPNNTHTKSIFNIWDTTNMSNPALLASIDFNRIPRSEDPYNPSAFSNEQNGMTIQNGFAFICLGRQGVHVIDVRNPQEPVLFNQIDTPGISRQIN